MIVFHDEAARELDLAAEFYERDQVGLGDDFLDEIEFALARILEHPLLWPFIQGTLWRRHLIRRFPYGIIYETSDEGLFVLAVTHLHRDPDYWKTRI